MPVSGGDRAAAVAQSVHGQPRAATEQGWSQIPTAGLWDPIVSKLRLQWIPEQIVGWLALKRIAPISFQWIYARIGSDRKAGRQLYPHLRWQGRKLKRRPQAGRGPIAGRVDISEQPVVAKAKSRVGAWEVDTEIGSGHQGVAVTAVDRKSNFTLTEAVPRKTQQLVGVCWQPCLSR